MATRKSTDANERRIFLFILTDLFFVVGIDLKRSMRFKKPVSFHCFRLMQTIGLSQTHRDDNYCRSCVGNIRSSFRTVIPCAGTAWSYHVGIPGGEIWFNAAWFTDAQFPTTSSTHLPSFQILFRLFHVRLLLSIRLFDKIVRPWCSEQSPAICWNLCD